jgi:hypothetical protein
MPRAAGAVRETLAAILVREQVFKNLVMWVENE